MSFQSDRKGLDPGESARKNQLPADSEHQTSTAAERKPESYLAGSALSEPELPSSPAGRAVGKMGNAAGILTVILESSSEAIVVKNLEREIVLWSRGAERLYEYSAEEAIGQPIALLMPREHVFEADEITAKILRGEVVQDLETVRVARGGRMIDICLTARPLQDENGQIIGILTIARDTTEPKRAEKDLHLMRARAEHRALLLDAASRVALDILASRTGVEALRHIADAARTLAQARYAALGVASVDGHGLSEFVTVGMTDPEERRIASRPMGYGVLGLLLKRSDPLRIDNISDHPASVGFPAGHPPMSSFLGVPIRRGEVVLGSLYLCDKIGADGFTESDEEAIEALGAHAAVAIHNLQLLSRQRTLVSGLINAQEEERRAVAYDLHDGLTQYVMASYAHLDTFRHAHAAGKIEKAQRELDQGLRYLQEAVIESRRMVNGLRSLALDDLGLAGALEQLIIEEKDRAGWKDADLIHNLTGRRFDKTLETAIYRVAQEALTNARKHSGTDRVRIMLLARLEDHPGCSQLTLEVRDWGKGFSPREKISEIGHVGLQGMMERVSLMGGEYELQSAPGGGTAIRALFPVIEVPAPRLGGGIL